MNLFNKGPVKLRSRESMFKIDCDALTTQDIETIAWMIAQKVDFHTVVGIPRGGKRLEHALRRYESIASDNYLIVDDVFTSGTSMEEARLKVRESNDDIIGVVIFARGMTPDWITALFTLDTKFQPL